RSAMLLVCACSALAQQPAPAQQNSPSPAQRQLPLTPDQQLRQQRRQTEQAATTESGRLGDYEGYTISKISFGNAQRKDQQQLPASLPLQPGDKLDRAKLRASIERLYATNHFHSIRAQAMPVADRTLELVFDVEENLFIGTLALTGGPRPPTSSQLLNA